MEERKGFKYVVSARFSCLQLEILRWAVIWIKEVRCLDRASSGHCLVGGTSITRSGQECGLQVRERWMQVLAVP